MQGRACGNLASAHTLDCAIQASCAASGDRVSNSAFDIENGDARVRTLARHRVRARADAPGAERALHVRIRTRPLRERQHVLTMSGGNRIFMCVRERDRLRVRKSATAARVTARAAVGQCDSNGVRLRDLHLLAF